MILFLVCFSFWSSDEIWKQSFQMENLSYLPIVPLFKLIKTDMQNKYVIIDALTETKSTDLFQPEIFIDNLNQNNSPQNVKQKLDEFCLKNVSQACLIIGRIYEFGSYIFSENISLAYSYYLRAYQLGSKNVLPILSYFHRHYFFDIERSILESDLSPDFLESALPMAFQYHSGISRPFSCKKAFEILQPFSYAFTSIMRFIFPGSEHDNRNMHRTHAHLYFKAKSILSRPYVSVNEIQDATNLLTQSIQYQYHESASILAQIHLDGYLKTPNMSLINYYLDIGSKLKDPLAYYLLSCFLSIDDPLISKYSIAFDFLKNSAHQGFAPSIHRIGYLTKKGYLGFRQNNNEAFRLFLHSAALGYQPSLYEISKFYFEGKGTKQNCNNGYSTLTKIIDLGPFSQFLNRYVSRGSKSAFLKMIDMNLTPLKFIQIDSNNSFTKSIVNLTDFSIEDELYRQKKKFASVGNESAIVYLILTSPFEEALEWQKKLNMISPVYFFISFPIKTFLFFKNLWKYNHNQLSVKEAKLFREIANTVIEYLTIFMTFITLVLFICLRVSKIFQ